VIQQANQDVVYHAIAHHTRRAILDMLQTGPKGVTEIAGRFTVSQSAISQQLRVLLEASLVTADITGRERIYRINPRGFRPVHDWITRVFSDPAGHVWALKTKRRSEKGE